MNFQLMNRLYKQAGYFLVLLLLWSPMSWAADELQITPLESIINVSDRGIVTLRFEVQNTQADYQDFIENIQTPEGWFLLSTNAPFYLNAGDRDLRLIHMSVPRNISAGQYTIPYQVSAQDNVNVNGFASVIVQVEGTSGVELIKIQSPENLLAGEPYEVVFQVKNLGNRSTHYNFKLEQNDGYAHEAEPHELTLKAGQTGIVKVTGAIPDGSNYDGAHSFSLRAIGGSKEAKTRVSIPLVSYRTEGLSPYHRLQGTATLSHSQNKQDQQQTQLNLNVQGSLDQQGKHNVSLYMRSGRKAGQEDRQDEAQYRARYWNDQWQVDTGHLNFQTNRLAGHNISGVGAEVKYRPNLRQDQQPLEVRAFQGKTQVEDNLTEQEKVQGLSAQYRFNKTPLRIGASFIKYQEGERAAEVIHGLNAAWTKGRWSFQGEFSQDDHASARAIDIGYNHKRYSLNFNHLRGEPEFTGAIQDRETNYASANFKVNDNSRIRVAARQSRDNLANDSSKTTKRQNEQSIQYSHTLGAKRNIQLTTGYRIRKESEEHQNTKDDITIKSATAGYSHTIDQVRVRADLEHGTRKDHSTGTETQGTKQQVAVDWTPNKDTRLGLTYANSDSLSSDVETQSVGLRGSYQFNKNDSLSAYWQRRMTDDDESTDNLNIAYNKQFNDGDRVSVRASQSRKEGTDNETAWRLGYSTPIGIPFRPRHDIATLKGMITFKDNNEPASNVIINLDGQKIVTNQKGEFDYGNVLAKSYQLSVDTSRLEGTGYILGERGNSVTVDLKPKETKRLKLSLSQGASIKGTLKTFIKDNRAALNNQNKNIQAPLIADQGIRGILLELTPNRLVGSSRKKDDKVFRRLTDSRGEFAFLGIPEGQWSLRVVDINKLPKNFKLTQKQFLIDIKAGEQKDMLIRVLPSQQTIQKTGPSQGFSVSG